MSGLCWSAEDEWLLSFSAHDGAILQWRHVDYEATDEPRPEAAAAAEAGEAELDSDLEGELRTLPPMPAAPPLATHPPRPRPYLSEAHPPSEWREPLDGGHAPPDSLSLEWAYGVRCHDCRGHVHWSASGEAIFPAATVGVVFDVHGRRQRFFVGHTAELLCLALHPNGVYAASGQAAAPHTGAAPFTCVWDTRTCQGLATLRGAHALGIAAVAFDAGGGNQLATAGLEPSHAVALWDWERGVLLARVSTGAARIFGLSVRPSPTAADPRAVEIAACGVRSLCFLIGGVVGGAVAAAGGGPAAAGGGVAAAAATEGATEVLLLRCRRGAWRGAAAPCTLLCVAHAHSTSASGGSGECIAGSARGELLLWQDYALLRVVHAHAGPVMSLAVPPAAAASAAANARLLYSVGKGGKVRRWGEGLRDEGTLDLRQTLASLCDVWGRPLTFRGASLTFRAASLCAQTGRLLLCSASGELLTLTPNSGELQLLLQGHAACRGAASPGSLDALATHPSRALAVTAASDMTLRLWGLTEHRMVCMRPLPATATSAAFAPDGELMCVGLATGDFLLLATHDLRPVGGGGGGGGGGGSGGGARHAEAPRGAVLGARFSPEGSMLALASADGCVHVYAQAAGGGRGWAAGWRRVAQCVGHAGAVHQLDWSQEAMALAPSTNEPEGRRQAEVAGECWLLRSCSDAAELMHWELLCERETARNGTQLGAVTSARARCVRQAAAVRDVPWSSDSVGFAWATLALAPTPDAAAPPGGHHAAHHAAPLLPPPAVHRSHDGHVLAAAHAHGGVALWRWPANRPGAACKRYLGHAAPPSSVAFTHDDSLLLTAGGSDLTLLQWRHHAEDGAAADPAASSLFAEELDSDVEVDLAAPYAALAAPGSTSARGRRPRGGGGGAGAMPAARRAFLEASSLAQAARAPGAPTGGLQPHLPSPLDGARGGGAGGPGDAPSAMSLMALDELAAPQSFVAMRPWLRTLRPPSDVDAAAVLSDAAPREAPVLRWVHGVRAHDLRASLLLSAHGDAIYPAAALCVVMPLAAAAPPAAATDASAGAATPPPPPPPSPPRFYREHTAAVLSMALHPDGVTVASSQQGSEPPILVWDAGTLKTVAVLRRGHSVGVSCLAFGGGDGSLLASVDLAASPLLCLWDWRRGQLLASACVGRQRVLSLAFNPATGALMSSARRQLRFWSCEAGRLVSRRALFGEGAAHNVLSAAFSQSGRTMLCATAGGALLHWSGGRCVQVLPPSYPSHPPPPWRRPPLSTTPAAPPSTTRRY